MLAAMAATKRPAHRKHDRVTLSRIKSVIPAYGGKPFVGRDTVLTVSHLTGTGSKRNPWHVVVTDGTHFWHLEPDDVQRVDNDEGAHSTMKQRGTKRELNDWLGRHGYDTAKEKQPRHATMKSRFWYFAELNASGGVRDRFGPFASKREAALARQRAVSLFREKRLDQVRSSVERFPSNVPNWMRS